MKKYLYLGTDPSRLKILGEIVPFPLIEIVPKPLSKEIRKALEELDSFSHIIFTSKHGVRLFFALLEKTSQVLSKQRILSVGKVTTAVLEQLDVDPKMIRTASYECQEGIIALLQKEELSEANILIPRSNLSRAVLRDYFVSQQLLFVDLPIYTTIYRVDVPCVDFSLYDGLIFTSPSTVEAFSNRFHEIPRHLEVLVQGDVTKKMVEKLFKGHSLSVV
jgi:uroporphyrinogen-III synthase